MLEVISSDFLFHTYESMPEGEMTKLRASLVCEPTLAYCADVIPLGDYLLLGKGEDLTGGRKRPSVVSDAMEAVRSIWMVVLLMQKSLSINSF